LRRQRGAGQFLFQRAAGAEFQREIRQTVIVADIVNLHYFRMLQAGNCLSLNAEAVQILLAGMGARQDHLEGDEPIRLYLPRPVHHAHAPAPQLAQNIVAGD
jgi:hypothetical protein